MKKAKSKRMQNVYKEFDTLKFENKILDFNSIMEFLKNSSKVKFTESVDVSIVINMDPKKPNNHIRGSVFFPNSTIDKLKIVCLLTKDSNYIENACDADYVGGEELVEKIINNEINFDVLLATMDMMGIIAMKLGKILGPKGLIPSKKNGTILTNVSAISEFKKGRISFKTDKTGVINLKIGNLKMSSEEVKENYEILISTLNSLKVREVFISKVYMMSTMGSSILLKRYE